MAIAQEQFELIFILKLDSTEELCKSSVYFRAPSQLSAIVPPHFVCSGDATGLMAIAL